MRQSGMAWILLGLLSLSGWSQELGVPKVYVGNEGLEVTVLRYGPREQHQSLVQFSGVDSPWNGQVFLAEVSETDRSVDYVLQVDGKEWHCIVGRERWGDWSYEAFVRGVRRDFRLRYDNDLSKRVDARELAARYRESSRP